jgi:hypothetical protein
VLIISVVVIYIFLRVSMCFSLIRILLELLLGMFINERDMHRLRLDLVVGDGMPFRRKGLRLNLRSMCMNNAFKLSILISLFI